LTWSGDPRTTQAIQWRTSVGSKANCVRYHRATEQKWQEVKADTTKIEDAHLENDKVCEHHTAQLEGLDPGTNYVYEAGHGSKWTSETQFSTAPATGSKFTFIYMGDAQVGDTILDGAGDRIEIHFHLHGRRPSRL
ncbi:MAG: fibronectin type III domain-containing protein, partial [Candidatus Hydrogenedentes bacterium]|nr:fibronectin type III domain-containing protein [Candidatus Hydrogenedentota bacterium]